MRRCRDTGFGDVTPVADPFLAVILDVSPESGVQTPVVGPFLRCGMGLRPESPAQTPVVDPFSCCRMGLGSESHIWTPMDVPFSVVILGLVPESLARTPAVGPFLGCRMGLSSEPGVVAPPGVTVIANCCGNKRKRFAMRQLRSAEESKRNGGFPSVRSRIPSAAREWIARHRQNPTSVYCNRLHAIIHHCVTGHK